MLWHYGLQGGILYWGLARYIVLRPIVLVVMVDSMMRILLIVMWLVSVIRHSDQYPVRGEVGKGQYFTPSCLAVPSYKMQSENDKFSLQVLRHNEWHALDPTSQTKIHPSNTRVIRVRSRLSNSRQDTRV